MNRKGNPKISEYGEATRFTAGCSQVVEIAKMGAEASNKVQKEKKDLQEEWDFFDDNYFLNEDIIDKYAKAYDKKTLKKLKGVKGISNENLRKLSVNIKSVSGDLKAYKIVHEEKYDNKNQAEKNKIDRERLELDKQKYADEKKQMEIAMNSEYNYLGVPVNAIAPVYAPMLHHIENKEYKEYVLSGGRGSAKSSVISLNVIDLIEKNEDYNALVVRKVGNTLADSVYSQIVWAIGMLGLGNQYKCTKSPMEITKLKTGQKIFFRGTDDPLKLKSIKATHGYIAVLWFEEVDTFLGEEEIRNIKQSAIRGGEDAFIFMSFNPPKTKMNWANKYVLTPRKDTYMLQTTYKDVPPKWLGKPFIEDAEYLKEVNYNAYEHEYLGVANGNGGNVFENIEIREITDEEVKNFDRIYHGVDWGYYPDIYAFTTCHYDVARQTLYIYEEYTSNKESNERTADVLINQFNVGADLITCDSAEPKSIADYRAFGINARETEKGAGSVEYSMKWLARLKIVIDPIRCPVATKEFSNYEYERDKEGNVISGYPDKDNHTIDSIRYALNPIWRRRGQ